MERDIRDIAAALDNIANNPVTESPVPNIVEVYKMVKQLERRIAKLESTQTAPAAEPAAQTAPAAEPTAQAAPAA